MNRISRSLTIVLLCIFSCVWLTGAPAPTARAAGPFLVNTARDLSGTNDPQGGCYTNTSFNTLCSLRQAIFDANANPGSTIKFDIPPADPGYVDESISFCVVQPCPPNPVFSESRETWRIRLQAGRPLPIITASGTLIDGLSQAQARGGNPNVNGPEIVIDGQDVFGFGGVIIQANNVELRSIGIINFVGSSGTNDNSLQGVGIEVSGTGNKLLGNYIGTIGYGAALNNDFGIWLRGGSNIIGGDSSTVTYAFNVISGNRKDGIVVEGPNNKILGNFIGTDDTGLARVSNGGNGIQVRFSSASGNLIGIDPADTSRVNRNVISGNNGYGIRINNAASNSIHGNKIGLNSAGTGVISNTLGGIQVSGLISSAASTQIGGDSEYTRNYIAGNGGPGIWLNGFFVSNTKITNNYIGVGTNYQLPSGLGSGPNNTVGILIDKGASGTTIGGAIIAPVGFISTLDRYNAIAGNSGDGIRMVGEAAVGVGSNLPINNTVISGNYIGVGPGGLNTYGAGISYANSGDGINMSTQIRNTKIGDVSDKKFTNQINNNRGAGIRATSATTTTVNLTTVSGNLQSGVVLSGTVTTQIGGPTSAITPVISGNGVNGVTAINASKLNLSFVSITGNGADGLSVTGGSATNVLTSTITGNADNGVRATNTSALLARGNAINRNRDEGVNVSGGSDVQLRANTIISNTFNGVLASGGAQKVTILDNSISENLLKGIELNPENFYPIGDSTLANHDIDPTFSLKLRQDGRLTGRVRADGSSAAGTAASCLPAATCTIQIFTTKGDGQGRDKLNVPVTIDGSGYFTTTLSTLPSQLALTATDAAGNTSEFANFIRQIGPLALTALRPVPPQQNAVPGQTITYTARLTNTGTIGLNDIGFSFTSSRGFTANEIRFAPPTPLSLDGGEGKTVTMTLSLPRGSTPLDKRILAGGTPETTRLILTSTRYTTLTVGLDTRTTIDPLAIVGVAPLTNSGDGLAGQITTYTHQITNTGNVTATIDLSQAINPLTGSVGYTTTLPLQLVIPPGQSRTLGVPVYVPKGAQAGQVNQTIVSLSVQGYPSQSTLVTDTTTVIVTPNALMNPKELVGSGKAGTEVPFRLTVENRSNGLPKLKLVTSSSLNSSYRFVSDQPGFIINADNTFSFTASSGNTVSFLVYVKISRLAQRGQQDIGTIGLESMDKKPVAGASARYTINVTANADFLTYLPLSRR